MNEGSQIILILSILALLVSLGLMFTRKKETYPNRDHAYEPPPTTTAPSRMPVVLRLENCIGEYEVDVVGESHYIDAFDQVTGGRGTDGHFLAVEVFLIQEDQNIYDNMAIGVYSMECKKLGHLSKSDARAFRRQINGTIIRGAWLAVPARITGGWYVDDDNQGNYGIKLDLPATEIDPHDTTRMEIT